VLSPVSTIVGLGMPGARLCTVFSFIDDVLAKCCSPPCSGGLEGAFPVTNCDWGLGAGCTYATE